jgi:sec-independent protein translocase protein TatA
MKPAPWQLVFLLLVVVIIWGAPKLPTFAKSLGQSMRIFRKEMKQLGDERDEDKKASSEKEQPKNDYWHYAATPIRE